MRIRASDSRTVSVPRYQERSLTPLFQATVEATEEAIYNSLLQATDMTGHGGHKVKALPVGPLRRLLEKSGRSR